MKPILEVNNITMHFPVMGGLLKRQVGKVHAVTDVSFNLMPGETLGVVGESGCGKTTLGRAVIRLYEPTSGSVKFEGKEITSFDKAELKEFRKEMQMVFQDPYASLNPRMTIRAILEEPLSLHKVGTPEERLQKVMDIVKLVGLRTEDVLKYPHEFSGGQRQRIGIARALMLNPKIVICDEAVSALDVSIQSQVLNLFNKLQKELNLTYIFISHDLTVVKYISDRVAVMYLGRVVELASSQQIYENPQHPYTKALLASMPIPDPRKRSTGDVLAGDVPSPAHPPPGCAFAARCSLAKDICRTEVPAMRGISEDMSHTSACHMIGESN